MSYSANLKREILGLENEKNEVIFAELFGILASKNAILENGLFFSTENVSFAKRVYSNLRKVTNLDIQLKYIISKRQLFSKTYRIILIPTKQNEKEYKSFFEKLFSCKNCSAKNVEDEEKIAGVIRGAFLSCGYIKAPEKSYALDFFLDSEDFSNFLFNLFSEMGKKISKTEKKEKKIVYLRNSEDILDIIFLTGAVNSFFAFEEVTINKQIRNKINRNMNWEIANETKKISASEKQIKMIKYIDEKIGLSELSNVLQETAKARLENEELSLQELADLMNISKSGIKNRFRRIETMYKDLLNY